MAAEPVPDMADWDNIAELSGKYPEDLFPAFYPVEYDNSIIGDRTSDTVLPGTNTIILPVSAHPADIKCMKKFLMPGSGQNRSVRSGTGDVWVWEQGPLYPHAAFQSFFIDRSCFYASCRVRVSSPSASSMNLPKP